MLLIIFWVMTLCCCLYAGCAGGPVGRIGAALIVLKTIAEFFLTLLDQSWSHTQYSVFMLDFGFLTAFLTLAYQGDRYWPLWTSGCAMAAVAVHLASLIEIGLDPKIYQGLKCLWAIPMQLFMVRGIMLDRLYQRYGESYLQGTLSAKFISKFKWRT